MNAAGRHLCPSAFICGSTPPGHVILSAALSVSEARSRRILPSLEHFAALAADYETTSMLCSYQIAPDPRCYAE